jgi:hypothetical protein
LQRQPKENQLALSQGKKKKENEVDDEDVDDVVRMSVSQNKVPVTLCIYQVIVPQHSVFIALSTYQTVNSVGGVSHLPSGPHCVLQSV